jgi:hypothetical protein
MAKGHKNEGALAGSFFWQTIFVKLCLIFWVFLVCTFIFD